MALASVGGECSLFQTVDSPPGHTDTGSIEYHQIVIESFAPTVQGDSIVDPTGCYWYDRPLVLATNKYGEVFCQGRSPDLESDTDEEARLAVHVPCR